MRLLIQTICMMALLACAIPASAGIYTYLDNRGQRHYTNVPTDIRAVPLGRLTLRPQQQASPKRVTRQKRACRPYSGSNMASLEYHIRNISMAHRIDPLLIKAIIKAESDFDPYAVSHHGAKGLMQLMPETARDLQVTDPFDPYQNIAAGTRYLRNLLDTFGGDLRRSLAAYNAGPGRVARCKGLPDIPETLQYVNKVLRQYRIYRGSVRSMTRINVRSLVTVH